MPDQDYQTSSLWWSAPKKGKDDRNGERVAMALTRVATSIETATIPDRWRSLVYFRYMTGRPTVQSFAYSMARRPASFLNYYSGWTFAPLRYSLIGTIADVYVNRLLAHEIFVTMLPDRGDFAQRQVSKDLEGWIEGGFDELGFWKEWKAMGLDALTYGTGFLYWGEGLDGKMMCEAVNPDELLWRNRDERNPRDVIRRVWASKEDVLTRYGKTQEAKNAINMAETAFPCFYFGPGQLDTSDVIPMLEGWRLPHPDGSPGRHVLCVGSYTVLDEEWEDPRLPFVAWKFHEVPGCLLGQGVPELLLEINEEIDRMMASIQESDMRAGFGKWLIEAASLVNPQALGDTTAAAVEYNGVAPQYITPEPIGQYALEHLQAWIQMGMTRCHISEMAAKAEQPKALTSAVALERWAQIDDANFAEMTGRLEDVVLQSAYQMIRLGKKLKPSYTRPGRTRQIINWDKLKLDGSKPCGLQAFSTGRLGQTVAGKIQQLKEMLAEGTVSRQTYTKYVQVPDMGGMLDLLNAPQESVDRQLDRLVFGKRYEPPAPFLDLDFAIAETESRYLLEQDEETPREQLDKILMYRAALIEFREQRNTPDMTQAPALGPAVPPDVTAMPAPGQTDSTMPLLPPGDLPPAAEGGGFGIQPPAGAAPMPSPYPIPPDMRPV